MTVVWAMLFIVFAGVIRGYTGFGFSVIAVLCLNFIFSPVEAIVIAIGLDMLSSLCLVLSVYQQVKRSLLMPLLLGMLAALPPALVLINYLPSQQLKMLIAGICFIAGGLIMLNLRLNWINQKMAIWAGMLSGFTMTTASAGGPPLIVYLMNLPIRTTELRATSIVFFIASSLISLLGLLYLNLIEANMLWQIAILTPAAFIGNWLGKHLYNVLPQMPHRWLNAPLLMLLASVIFIS